MVKTEIRCTSPICIVKDGVRGRMFVPGHEGMSKLWCPQCLQIGSQMTFYAHQTSDMIRNIYTSYVDTDLPSEVKLILKQFAREVVQQLGEEL